MPICVPRGLKLILSDCSYFLMKVLLRNPELSHLTQRGNSIPYQHEAVAAAAVSGPDTGLWPCRRS